MNRLMPPSDGFKSKPGPDGYVTDSDFKKAKEILTIIIDETEDSVNHPAHYTSGNIEVIDAIEDWNLDFRLANVVKYVARAGKKDPTKVGEDLKKAQWYLNRYIEKNFD